MVEPELLAPASPAAPPAATARTVLGHPPGLFLLATVEMWERFSYYGMRALLVLYLVHEAGAVNPGRGWSKAEASGLYGWYTGLAYLMPMIGGLIADRLIGTHRSLLAGGVLITLGHCTLAASGIGSLAHSAGGLAVFMAGLALIVIGTGHFKPSIAVMIGGLYPPGDARRDGAFTIYYMGVNLGAFLSALVCGTLGEVYGWHWGFGAAAVGMLLGLSAYVVLRARLLGPVEPAPRAGPDRTVAVVAGGIACALAVGALFQTGAFAWLGRAADELPGGAAGWLAVTLGVLLGGAVWFTLRQPPADRGRLACILILMVFNSVFWLAFEQAGSSLNLFAEEHTERIVALPGLGVHEVPATWFQSVNPLVILLCGPLFALLWARLGRRAPGQPLKIALGLGLLSIGYVFMVCGSLHAQDGAKAGMIWLLATYVLHTWGELCLSPTGMAFVTRAAPPKAVTILVGVWFLSNMLANKIGGMLAGQVEGIEQGRVALPWYPWFRLGGQADFFLLFVLAAGAAAIGVALLAPWLGRLLGERRNQAVPVDPPSWQFPIAGFFSIANALFTTCIIGFYVVRYITVKPYLDTSLDTPVMFSIGLDVMLSVFFLVIVPFLLVLPLAIVHTIVVVASRKCGWRDLFPIIIFMVNVLLALNTAFHWFTFLIPDDWFHLR